MRGAIVLGEKSQGLIKELLDTDFSLFSTLENMPRLEDTTDLMEWLTWDIIISDALPPKHKEKIEFILASLHAELLRDLLISMQGIKLLDNKIIEEDPPFSNQAEFILLAIAGTLLAACEGFDSIASLMSVLSFPALSILAAGVAFAALSIFVFYGFDLVQVSQNLGIKLKESPKLLDVYLLQMAELKAIRRTMESANLVTLSVEDLEQYLFTLAILQKRLKALCLSSEQFDLALNSGDMEVTETIVSWMAGLLFFGSGFFAGQSVALFFFELCMATVAPTFLPVVLFSLGIGVAAFCIYWNVERIGIKALIGSWFGLDEEKIKTLCDPEKLVGETLKQDNLMDQILSTKAVLQELAALQRMNKTHSEHTAVNQPVESVESVAPRNSTIRTSNNIYSFHLHPNAQGSNHSDLDYDDVSGYSYS
ncbi:hypothetical protein [uncultured Legionella sp.]|uniref:hypothetical protein n=1 Tax=uncultured Legionella sp. TaxID=210934 RepID=UPI0026142EF3|nr:hypothetical protein [uncultured Legionella sp.]